MLGGLVYGGPRMRRLHEEYAVQGKIDEAAPVTNSSSIVIEAPVERVWEVMADMRSWPSWYQGFALRHLGEVRPGERFRWTLRGTRLSSTFAVVAPQRELSWTGRFLWIKAVDRMTLEPTEGGTRVTMSESMAGWLLPLFYNAAKLRKGHEHMLNALKAAIEGSR